MSDKICVENGRLSYFDNYGKLEIFTYRKTFRERILCSFHSMHRNELEWKGYKWILCFYLIKVHGMEPVSYTKAS